VDWILLLQNKHQWRIFVKVVKNFQIHKMQVFSWLTVKLPAFWRNPVYSRI